MDCSGFCLCVATGTIYNPSDTVVVFVRSWDKVAGS